jgi:hypothetical protein
VYVREPASGGPSAIVVAELAPDERRALEALICAGVAHLGYNSYGPGLGEADPLVAACRKLGLQPEGLDRYFCPAR